MIRHLIAFGPDKPHEFLADALAPDRCRRRGCGRPKDDPIHRGRP